MAKGNRIRAAVAAAALSSAAGSAWAGEATGGSAWPGWIARLDPAAVGAVALLVVAVLLSSIERRRRLAHRRDLAPNAGRSAKVTPISAERAPRRRAHEPAHARRAAGPRH